MLKSLLEFSLQFLFIC